MSSIVFMGTFCIIEASPIFFIPRASALAYSFYFFSHSNWIY